MGGSNIKRRVKRENVKKKERRGEVSDSSSEDEEKERPPSPRKTRSGGSVTGEASTLSTLSVSLLRLHDGVCVCSSRDMRGLL